MRVDLTKLLPLTARRQPISYNPNQRLLPGGGLVGLLRCEPYTIHGERYRSSVLADLAIEVGLRHLGQLQHCDDLDAIVLTAELLSCLLSLNVPGKEIYPCLVPLDRGRLLNRLAKLGADALARGDHDAFKRCEIAAGALRAIPRDRVIALRETAFELKKAALLAE